MNPFRLLPEVDLPIAETRDLTVCAAPVQLAWIPARTRRRNVPGAGRPPFRGDFGAAILAEEALWRGDGVAWTPNKFPFGRAHGILWRDGELRREPDATLLRTAFQWTSDHGGTALGNCVGSAASIQRAHLHLVEERLPFLSRLPLETHDDELRHEGVEIHRVAGAAVPFAAVRLRGAPEARARAAAERIALRLTAAFNLVDDGEATWIFPRGVETPAPHFPFALGAAELWGRWCYGEEDAYRDATPERLERALEAACVDWPG